VHHPQVGLLLQQLLLLFLLWHQCAVLGEPWCKVLVVEV
jgi:hypothetical protein